VNYSRKDKELESIGKRIQAHRKNKRLSQEMLAKKLNISRNTLTKLEGGFRDFKTTEVLSIAKALEVSADYLLGLEFKSESKEKDAVNVLERLGYVYNADGWGTAFPSKGSDPDKCSHCCLKCLTYLQASISGAVSGFFGCQK